MNILLIMSDSLSPHFTSLQGSVAGGTPNLERLAESGVTFERTYCNSPLCAPSRASLVTGRYVSDVECFDNGAEFASGWPTMGHVLGASGFETAIIGKMHFVGHDQVHGFDRRIAIETDYTKGYDPDYYKLAYRWDQPSAGNPYGKEWMGESYVYGPRWDDYRHHYDRDELIHRSALEYLSGKGPDSSPFFCCVSYHAPHNPFWIPESMKARFRGANLPLPAIPDGTETCHGPMDSWLNDFHYVPEIRDQLLTETNLRWLYETFYGVIYDLDRRVGELLERLDSQGIRDDTAIIFTSDHGDMMGKRGMVQKRYLYEYAVRVPLIWSFPKRWQKGVRLKNTVSLVDLLPTLAAMAGSTRLPSDLPGTSLVESLANGVEPPERTVFCEYHGEGVHAPCFIAVRGRLKYLYVHGHEERLYDTEADPDEYTNIIADTRYAAEVKSMRAELLSTFDPDRIAASALRSQHNRRLVYDCYRERRKNEDEAMNPYAE